LNDEARREAHPGPDRPPQAIHAEWIKGAQQSSSMSGSSVRRPGPPSLVPEA
jgi:hypothetical protein